MYYVCMYIRIYVTNCLAGSPESQSYSKTSLADSEEHALVFCVPCITLIPCLPLPHPSRGGNRSVSWLYLVREFRM